MRISKLVALITAMTDWTYGSATLWDVSSLLNIDHDKLLNFLSTAGLCSLSGERNPDISSRKLMDGLLLSVCFLAINQQKEKDGGSR